MFCINCNKEVEKDAKVCPFCGTDFTEKPKPVKKNNKNHECNCEQCECKKDNSTLVGVLMVALFLILGLGAICTIIVGGAYLFNTDNKKAEKEVKDKVSWDGIDLKIPEGYKYKYKEDCIEIYNEDVIYDLQVSTVKYDEAKANKDKLLKSVDLNEDESLTIKTADIEIYDYREYIIARGENETHRYIYFITTSSETEGTIRIAAVYKIGASNDKKVIGEITKLVKGIKASKEKAGTIEEERTLTGLLGEDDGIENEATPDDYEREFLRALEF